MGPRSTLTADIWPERVGPSDTATTPHNTYDGLTGPLQTSYRGVDRFMTIEPLALQSSSVFGKPENPLDDASAPADDASAPARFRVFS